MTERLVIAGAAGFWGDRNDALLDQVSAGPVDVVLLDYLAEVTMSILRVKQQRDPEAGFATDFIQALEPALGIVSERGIKIVTNAGGMNPRACANAVLEQARRQGISGLRVGVVTGDDVYAQLDALIERGVSLDNLDSQKLFSSIREQVASANAYLGAEPIRRALDGGAQIVITGRCTDSALALGPLMAHYDWQKDDWDRLAAGVVAGHVLECGAQASGGNFAGGWRDVPALERVGYPIAMVEDSGDFVVTKHESLGGLVNAAVVKEQLIYEIGDPRCYVTPDVCADFTSFGLEEVGENQVRISGVKGRAAPDQLKVSISYRDGWRTSVALTFVWPFAVERAQETERLLLARCGQLGIEIERHQVNLLGVSGAHGPLAAAPPTEPNEVVFHMAVKTKDRDSAKRFGREIAPMILCGMPGACGGLSYGRPEPTPIVNFWPALIPRDAVDPQLEVLES